MLLGVSIYDVVEREWNRPMVKTTTGVGKKSLEVLDVEGVEGRSPYMRRIHRWGANVMALYICQCLWGRSTYVKPAAVGLTITSLYL